MDRVWARDKWITFFVAGTLVFGLLLGTPVVAQNRTDLRPEMLRDADHFQLRMAELTDRESWEKRASLLRKKLAILAGLWPEPARTPLHAEVFQERLGDGFSVAKVYFESLPGFFVTGNLYRPRGKEGPYPAVLTPHGHWKYGRLQNGEEGSILARCIDFARMGFVTLSIDMVGYNDSFQLPHDGSKSRAQLKADQPLSYEPRAFRADFEFPEAQFYGLSLGGLQLWNGIRALDFLSSLPEVDAGRIGVTGASGGATQTLLLMALDERVKVAAPVNIIGATKHPGCLCENIPGSWIDTSTLELAATFAPRPLLLVSASRDPWTHATPAREYPLLRRYYRLFGAEQNIQNFHIEGGHNYNAESRAAVYQWFVKHLNSPHRPIEQPPDLVEHAESLGDLRVFPDKLLPQQAQTGRRVVSHWKDASERSFLGSVPKTAEELEGFEDSYREALSLALSVETPAGTDLEREVSKEEARGPYAYRLERIGRRGKGDWFQLESARIGENPSAALILVYPENGSPLLDRQGLPSLPWLREFLDRGLHVFRVRGFASGALRIPRRSFDQYSNSDAYNRGNRLEAIQDTLTALSSVRRGSPAQPLMIVGLENAGLTTLFAAALFADVNRVAIDLDRRDPGYDRELMELLPVGSLGKLGGLRTAILLLAGSETTLFNAGPGFDSSWLRQQAEKLGFSGRLTILEGAAPVDLVRDFR